MSYVLLARLQFKKILKIGSFHDLAPDQVLVQQGELVKNLSFISSGEVSIEVDAVPVALCGPGNFIGEISFITGKPASAAVRANTQCRYLNWSQDCLHKLLEKDQSFNLAMHSILSKDLIDKLTTTKKNTL